MAPLAQLGLPFTAAARLPLARRAGPPPIPGVREVALIYRPRPDLATAPRSIRAPGDAAALCAWLRHLPHEEVWGLALNSANDVVALFQIGRGGLNSAPVDLREVFRHTILAGGVSLVLVHNHPSGSPTPSTDDRHLTRRLITAGALLEIQVLDHIIIGEHTHYSFVEQGTLPTAKPPA